MSPDRPSKEERPSPEPSLDPGCPFCGSPYVGHLPLCLRCDVPEPRQPQLTSDN
jgi:hypothetical protein